MNFVYFICIGLVSGWLAGKLTKGAGFGLLKNLAIGIVGSFVGGWTFDLVGLNSIGVLGSIITATAGAVILLFVLGKLKK